MNPISKVAAKTIVSPQNDVVLASTILPKIKKAGNKVEEFFPETSLISEKLVKPVKETTEKVGKFLDFYY